MEAKLTFKYDRQGDILYISKTPPYPEQQSEELGDELSPGSTQTGEIENLEVLFFSTHLLCTICLNRPSQRTCVWPERTN